MEYEKVKPRKWIQPVRTGYKAACCDCGLVHSLDFRVYKSRAQFRASRDTRATNALRKKWGDAGSADDTPHG